MKLLILASSLLSMSVFAEDVSSVDLSKLTITPVESLKLSQKNVTINGTIYQQNIRTISKNGIKSFTVDTPILVVGEIVNSVDGFSSYDVTGEIIVKLSGDADLEKFTQDNNLSIKQAYKSFYILKASDKNNLLPIVAQLKSLPNVVSATIDLADKSINTH
ncbi:hypothetical protein [Pseudoalteromonas denitrificans]|uniref:ASP external chaperone domain-containing protein n=1 Tax=Pseudoalteromonas denitrificans DSM 6059 TaxID=1123010 RepID=A0A1I1M0V2_9GAMM|nr:hypothetical protein [Pseudoalteromonas denitrificans]SFC78991.1 hypothetical protein SAMN02745724_02554 [Pseudoalteromonas denitrificans DSM 6059]